MERQAEAAIDGAFELSVTLSTDPHEWCETEDEPDGSQMFLYMEAGVLRVRESWASSRSLRKGAPADCR